MFFSIIFFILSVEFSCDSLVVLNQTKVDQLNKYHFEEETAIYVLFKKNISVRCDAGMQRNTSTTSALSYHNNINSNETSVTLHTITWMDTEGVQVFKDNEFYDDGNHTLHMYHAQFKDSRQFICQAYDSANNEVIFQHYIIVYDVPLVTLEYALVYEVAICEELLMIEKAENLRELAQLSRMSHHHGLIYSVQRYSCERFEDRMFSYATFYITCEDRENNFREVCDTVECYLKETRFKLFNASYDSFQRWYEVENHPGKYFLKLFKIIKMPEFKLVKEPSKHEYKLTCPRNYILWNNYICLPCLSGHYFNNETGNCTECSINTYQPFDLMTECFKCLPGWTTVGNASRGFSPCIPPPNATLFFLQHHVYFVIIVGIIFILALGLSVINKKQGSKKSKRMEETDEKANKKFEILARQGPFLKGYTGATKVFIHQTKKKPIIEVDRVEFLKEAQKRRKKVPKMSKTYVFATS